MRITSRGRYAISILYDLAIHGSNGPVSVKEMAKRLDMSVKYTEQIIGILNKAGYVNSSRGFQGGYQLKQSPDHYVIGDLLRLTEGNLSPVECLEGDSENCPKMKKCETRKLWEKVDDAVKSVVDHVTIADLIAWQQEETES